MAVTALTPVKVGLNAWADVTPTAAGTAADGVTIDVTKGKTFVIEATNTHASAAKTVTVKGGTGTRGVGDIAAKSLAALGGKAVIVLDSAYYHQNGKVKIIPESTDIKFSVYSV